MAVKQKQKKKVIVGVRAMILIPVIILGLVLICSNILSIANLRKVNANATEITDKHMVSIDKLDEIQTQAQNLHKMALSHIIATDLDTPSSEIVLGVKAWWRVMNNKRKKLTRRLRELKE